MRLIFDDISPEAATQLKLAMSHYEQTLRAHAEENPDDAERRKDLTNAEVAHAELEVALRRGLAEASNK